MAVARSAESLLCQLCPWPVARGSSQSPEQRGMCEQQPLCGFLALCVYLEDCSPSCVLGSAAEWEGSRNSTQLAWEVLQIFVAVWPSPALTQACSSWRGWLWCSAAAGEARVMWMRTLFWRGISLNPRGHPVCFLSSWMFCKSYEWWQRHTLHSSLLGVGWEFWLSKNCH